MVKRIHCEYQAIEFSEMAFGALGKNVPDVDGTPGYRGMAEASPRIAAHACWSRLVGICK